MDAHFSNIFAILPLDIYHPRRLLRRVGVKPLQIVKLKDHLILLDETYTVAVAVTSPPFPSVPFALPQWKRIPIPSIVAVAFS